jgi:hypothetical protein
MAAGNLSNDPSGAREGRRVARRRWPLWLFGPLLLVALAVVGSRQYFAHRDTEHAAFFAAGNAFNAFLADYCRAFKRAQHERDPDGLLDLYAASYRSPARGFWRWGAPRDIGGATLWRLVAEPSAPLTRPELERELVAYLGDFETIDKASCKIDLIESLDPARATLTTRIVIDARVDGLLTEDRLFVRLGVVGEGSEERWRIQSEELVDGVRVGGDTSAFEELDLDSVGIAYRHRRDPELDPYEKKLRFQMMRHAMGGVSVADFDGDTRPDLFFADGVASRLYRNVTEPGGEPRFSDVTAASGLQGIDRATSALVSDFDGDGDRDLFVARYLAGNLYYENLGDGRFADATARSGLGIVATSISVTALDYDRDGALDLYVAAYGDATKEIPRIPFFASNGQPSRLFHNEGGGRFRDVTIESGTGDTGWSLAVASGDFDADGWPDLVVANDFGRKNLYRNRGDGTFEEGSKEAGTLDFSGGMGVAIGDLEGDGYPDIYFSNIKSNQRWFGEEVTLRYYLDNVLRTRWAVADFAEYWEIHRLLGSRWREMGKDIGEGNSLLRNRGDGTFEELRNSATNQAGWGWGVAFFDRDNDADLDLYATNGWITNRPDTDL